MKTYLKSSASALVLASFLAAPAAFASDLNGGGYKDGHDVPHHSGSPAFVGFGVGVHGGGQFTNIDIMDKFDGIGADGLVGGAHAEYLFASGRFRVGPYVDGGVSNVNTEIGGTDLLNQDYYFGGGLKAGIVAFGSSLIFAKVGYEWAQWDVASVATADVESLVLGGGVETMIGQNVSVGLQADYLMPLGIDVEGTDVTDYLDESESLRVLARITYRQ